MFLRDLLSTKKKFRVEPKLAAVSFLAELLKFGVLPRAEGLACLRMLIFELHGHAIEMAVLFIESAGFYLYKSVN